MSGKTIEKQRCRVCAVRLDETAVETLCNSCRDAGLGGPVAPSPVRMDTSVVRRSLRKRGRGSWDVLLMCSGGKDSCYLAEQLATRLRDRRILLFTCDTGFLTRESIENLDYVSGRLNLEHLTYRPPFDIFRAIYRVGLTRAEDRWQGRDVCSACFRVMLAGAVRLACRLRVAYIVTGHDPMQHLGRVGRPPGGCITGFTGLSDDVRRDLSAGSRRFLDDCRREVRREKIRSLLLPWRRLPRRAAVFAIIGYNQDEVTDRMVEFGLPHVHPGSTNCLVESLMMRQAGRAGGRMPYEEHICAKVRGGMLSRRGALTMLEDWDERASRGAFRHEPDMPRVRAELGLVSDVGAGQGQHTPS